MNLHDQLLNSAKENHSNYGIMPASRYLQDMAGCLEGDYCPAQVMGLATTTEWTKALKTASNKLTYSSPECRFDTKSLDTAKGYILTATGIMSTSNMDVDGDILEAKGASFEANLPFLWQHIVMQPVGKALETNVETIKLSKDKDEAVDAVIFKAGILDVGNGLGRDTALLIEMDSLRISHGFEAKSADPIKGAGWHVKEYTTFEISGVTLPANTDAVFTEFSKEKSRFQSEPVKAWLKGHYDTRKRLWKGWSAEDSECTCQKSRKDDSEQVVMKSTKGEILVGKGTYTGGYLPGSWEATEAALRDQVKDHLEENGVSLGKYGWAWIEGTYANFVIASAYTDGEDVHRFFKIAWTAENGNPVLTGDPKEVQIDVSVSINDEKNRKALEDASEAIEEPEVSVDEPEATSEEPIEEPVEVSVTVEDPLFIHLGIN